MALDGRPAQNVEEDAKPLDYRLGGGTMALYNGHTGRMWIRLEPGQSRAVSVDRY